MTGWLKSVSNARSPKHGSHGSPPSAKGDPGANSIRPVAKILGKPEHQGPIEPSDRTAWPGSGFAISELEPIMIADPCHVCAMTKHKPGQDGMNRQASISEQRFESWAREFAGRAGSSGIDRSVVRSSLDRVDPNPSVVSADRNQPEMVITADDYLRRAMPAERIARGVEHQTVLVDELVRIEKSYGVDRRVVLAIWGIESDFGSATGDYLVVEALATLACDGRRRELAERELIAAFTILESREVRMDDMLGSWAGAMGHTQFMPSSFLAFAVDHDGDGRRDIWNPSNPLDALASTANYLALSGWQKGSPWGIEVRLPDNFDFLQADSRRSKPVCVWGSQGVTTADGAGLQGRDEATVFLPAGATGPAFLVFQNFTVLQKYNASGIYALAVSLLGDRIDGAGSVQAEWPANVRPLSLKDVRALQEKLRDLGFDPGGIDGLVGPDTCAAVRAFQRSAGLIPDGHVSNVILDHLG